MYMKRKKKPLSYIHQDHEYILYIGINCKIRFAPLTSTYKFIAVFMERHETHLCFNLILCLKPSTSQNPLSPPPSPTTHQTPSEIIRIIIVLFKH